MTGNINETFPRPPGKPAAKNGNGPKPEVAPNGSELANRFAGAYEQVMKERDAALAKVEQMNKDVERVAGLLKQTTDESILLKDEIASLHRQVETLKLECVHAIAERGAVEATLEAMMAIGRSFQVKNTPLISQGTNYNDVGVEDAAG